MFNIHKYNTIGTSCLFFESVVIFSAHLLIFFYFSLSFVRQMCDRFGNLCLPFSLGGECEWHWWISEYSQIYMFLITHFLHNEPIRWCRFELSTLRVCAKFDVPFNLSQLAVLRIFFLRWKFNDILIIKDSSWQTNKHIY